MNKILLFVAALLLAASTSAQNFVVIGPGVGGGASAGVSASSDVTPIISRIDSIERFLSGSDTFAITPGDPSRTTPNVFDWNTNTVNDIRATDYKVTTNPDAIEPLTTIDFPDGETTTFYIIGPLYINDTTFPNIAGAEIEAVNQNGIITYSLIRQMFRLTTQTDWPNTSFNDLTSQNNNVGEFRQASIDYIFTLIPTLTLTQRIVDLESLVIDLEARVSELEVADEDGI